MLMQQLAAICGGCRKRLEMLSGEGPALLTCVLASRRPSTPFAHEIRSLLLRVEVAGAGAPLQCQPGRRKRKENSRRRRRIAPLRLRPPPPPLPPLRLLLCPRTTPLAPAPPWLLGRNHHRRTHGAVMIAMLSMPATATVATVAIAETTTNKDNRPFLAPGFI